MRLRRSWAHWRQTRRLRAAVRRLRRKVARQEQLIRLRVEMLELLEQLEHPPLLMEREPPVVPTPLTDQLEELMELPPPVLTAEEMQELRELPMPDPLAEIEERLGLSTSPRSPQTWEG